MSLPSFVRQFALAAAVLPGTASAQIITNIAGCGDYAGQGSGFITGRITAACIPAFIAHLVQLIFGVIGVFFVVNLMIAGYQIAFGGLTGDKEAGKNRFKWSLIGLGIAVCSFVILDTVISVII
jgi:hypothetical protein